VSQVSGETGEKGEPECRRNLEGESESVKVRKLMITSEP
jgi:hypothetical protein